MITVVQPPVTIPLPSTRRLLLDAARSIAALTIVWLHTPRSAELIGSTAIGRFAVPFFTAAAVFFVFESLAKGRRRSFLEYTQNRFMRLYLPFLAWTAIYLLFKLAKSILAPNQPNDFPGLSAILTGGFYHLWFLPFILVVTLVTFTVGCRVIGNPAAETQLALVAAAIGTAIAVAPAPHVLSWLGPCAEYGWMALPAAFGGMTMVIAYRHGASSWMQETWATVAGLAITAVAIVWTWQAGRSVLAENLGGLAFLVFALGKWDGPWVRRMAVFGPLAYGIYLSHLLFIKTCEAVATKLRWPETITLDLLTFAIAIVGSTALVWLLSRNRWTNWLVA